MNTMETIMKETCNICNTKVGGKGIACVLLMIKPQSILNESKMEFRITSSIVNLNVRSYRMKNMKFNLYQVKLHISWILVYSMYILQYPNNTQVSFGNKAFCENLWLPCKTIEAKEKLYFQVMDVIIYGKTSITFIIWGLEKMRF